MNPTACTVEKTNLDWKEIIKIQEKIPFELEKGEMIRCFICDLGHQTGLFIFAHHLVGDGKAIMCFINDLMNALIGNQLTYQPLQLLTYKDITKNYQLPQKAKVYTTFCNWRWKIMGDKTFDWKGYHDIHQSYWKEHTSEITEHTFTKEETLKIRQLSKQMGVSVNTFLATTMIQGDHQKHSMGMITSLRQKDNKTMANLMENLHSSIMICIEMEKEILNSLKHTFKIYTIYSDYSFNIESIEVRGITGNGAIQIVKLI